MIIRMTASPRATRFGNRSRCFNVVLPLYLVTFIRIGTPTDRAANKVSLQFRHQSSDNLPADSCNSCIILGSR